MKIYNGSCHCGTIHFTFTAPEITGTMRCDCLIYARKASVMTIDTVPPDALEIFVTDGAQQTYQYGTKKRRGIVPFDVEARLSGAA